MIGFKLAKKTQEVQGIQIYLAKADQEEEGDDHEYVLYMLLESDLPNYSKVFNQRKSLAQKLGLQLVTCFCNLETYLNLEFEAGKPASEAPGFDDSDSIGSSPSQQFKTAADFDDGSFKCDEEGKGNDGEERASQRSLGEVEVSEIRTNE